MKSLFKELIEPFAVKLFIMCVTTIAPLSYNGPQTELQLTFLSSAQAAPESQQVPQGWESYLERPDILKVTAQSKDTVMSWGSLKAAHFSFVAELLALYPKNTHLYFLARDSEHLYDVARLVTQGTEDAQRLHLLNISRANMRHKDLLAYLNENGISAESLADGKKVVFIDTGFAGTIPRVIGENFPVEVRSKLKTHLVVSENPQHPSSRSFLVHLNPSASERTNLTDMHGTIVSYEHMPRYTDRSSQFVFSNGRYHPISPINQSTDGSVSKEKSLQFMQDLKAEWQKPETKARFQSEKAQVERIKQLLLEGTETAKTELRAELEKRKNTPSGRLYEAQIRDLLEAQKNTGITLKLTYESLGIGGGILKPHSAQASSAPPPKKFQLIQKYPEWAPILENPDDKIPELVKEKNWQMIGNLIDADIDEEINKLLLKSLFDGSATGEKMDLQLHMLSKSNNQLLLYLSYYILSKPHVKDMAYVLKYIIENTTNSVILGELETHVFSKPHAKDLKDVLRLFIEKRGPEDMGGLAKYVFSQPHTEGMEDLLELLIKKARTSPATFNLLSSELLDHVFTAPHTKKMFRLFKYVFENTPRYILSGRSLILFSKQHNQTREHLILEKSIEISDPAERKQWIETELSKLGSSPAASSLSVAEASKSISPALQAGDVIVIKNRVLKVIKKANEGRRGVVFQVQAANGAFYALKVAKNSNPETLSSLANESSKAKNWQALKIPHSKVLVQEKHFVLKTWIEGTLGDQVIEKYHAGDLSYKNAAESLLALVTKIKSQGAYVGDFRPANLIWTGKSWVIVDSGGIQQGMSLEEAQAKWSSADERGPKFQRRWKMPLPKMGAPLCKNIFNIAG